MKQEEIVKWFSALIVGALSTTAPIHPLLISMGLLVGGSGFLGVWADFKTGKGFFTSVSVRGGYGAAKMAVYSTLIVNTWIAQTYMSTDIIPIVKMIAGTIGFIEMVGCLESGGTILKQPVFKMIATKLDQKNRDITKGE